MTPDFVNQFLDQFAKVLGTQVPTPEARRTPFPTTDVRTFLGPDGANYRVTVRKNRLTGALSIAVKFLGKKQESITVLEDGEVEGALSLIEHLLHGVNPTQQEQLRFMRVRVAEA